VLLLFEIMRLQIIKRFGIKLNILENPKCLIISVILNVLEKPKCVINLKLSDYLFTGTGGLPYVTYKHLGSSKATKCDFKFY